jgi:hypothetical protein
MALRPDFSVALVGSGREILSSFLFVIVMEALGRMITATIYNGFLSGFSIRFRPISEGGLGI